MADEDMALVPADGTGEAPDQSILLAIDGETHTLGNMLRDVMWRHPHVQLASYTKEHPSSSEVLVRCQTTAAVGAEQGVVEALQISKAMLGVVEESMDGAVEAWQQQQLARSSGQQQQLMEEG